jgi:hypothetical protein
LLHRWADPTDYRSSKAAKLLDALRSQIATAGDSCRTYEGEDALVYGRSPVFVSGVGDFNFSHGQITNTYIYLTVLYHMRSLSIV